MDSSLVISWWAALCGLAVAIILILKKLNPVYSLLLGAICGSLLGGANLVQTLDILIKGSQSVMGTVLRVLAAGMLAGVMMESGAADTLARTIVNKLGGPFCNFGTGTGNHGYYSSRCFHSSCSSNCGTNCA